MADTARYPSAGRLPAGRLRRGWLLWADWCLATGRTSLDVEVEHLERFKAEVAGSSHLADIRATVREVGMPWPYGAGSTDPWKAAEVGLMPLDTSLAACPCTGWPSGYRGRRDAWLLVLTRGLRFTRTEALTIDASDLRDEWQIRGRRLSHFDDPAVCWRCVTARWLACREEEHHWSRSTVREQLVLAERPVRHDCESRGTVATDLPAFVSLSPALDQHGWLSGPAAPLDPSDPLGPVTQPPMSARAVTTVIADRCLGLPPTAPPEGEEPTPTRAVRSFDDTTFDRLDRACETADEVNARIESLLIATACRLEARHR